MHIDVYVQMHNVHIIPLFSHQNTSVLSVLYHFDFSNFQLSVLHRVKSYNVKFIHDHVIFRYLVLFSCKCWLYWPQAHYQHSPNLTIRVHPCTGHGAAVSDEPKQFSFCYVFYFYCWLNVHKLITYMKEFKWNGLFIAAIPVGFSLHFM